MLRKPYLTWLSLTFLLLATAAFASNLEVLGLFKNAALLKIDGKQKLVRAGNTWEGVTVIEADARKALVEINGEQQTVTVSQRISGRFKEPVGQTVRIRKNDHRQYITSAEINGRRTQVLVDTGANIVALSARHAQALGINYKDGIPSQVATASGIANAWSIMLQQIDVGGLRVSQVEASVIEGAYPETVLLGMSYLQHVEMREKDGILSLIRKF